MRWIVEQSTGENPCPRKRKPAAGANSSSRPKATNATCVAMRKANSTRSSMSASRSLLTIWVGIGGQSRKCFLLIRFLTFYATSERFRTQTIDHRKASLRVLFMAALRSMPRKGFDCLAAHKRRSRLHYTLSPHDLAIIGRKLVPLTDSALP
jgi:hypothetical protein